MPFLIVSVIIVLDQLAKYYAVKYLVLGKPLSVIPHILQFTLVFNRGAAFGILHNQLVFFIIISIIAIVIIITSIRKSTFLQKIALSMILAGAAGNLIDRVLWGHVIDFVDLYIWPVFNIADSAITIGAIILGWTLIKHERISH